MPLSPYVRQLREYVGHELLLLPGVTAVIRDGDAFLLARQRDTEKWSLVGGGVEPGEDPQGAIVREVEEELGCVPVVTGIVGAYGGPGLAATLPNGDQVSYVTVAFACEIVKSAITAGDGELIEVGWFTVSEARQLHRHQWIDRVLADASALSHG